MGLMRNVLEPFEEILRGRKSSSTVKMLLSSLDRPYLSPCTVPLALVSRYHVNSKLNTLHMMSASLVRQQALSALVSS
jgi:hypothetical protein